MGKIESMLEFGASFDWITPGIALLQCVLNGGSAEFGIKAYSGWGKRDVRNLLRSYGIKPWGVMYNINGNTLMFSVRKELYGDVADIIEYHRVPLDYQRG